MTLNARQQFEFWQRNAAYLAGEAVEAHRYDDFAAAKIFRQSAQMAMDREDRWRAVIVAGK